MPQLSGNEPILGLNSFFLYTFASDKSLAIVLTQKDD
jgi:hypothetical protein